ncbi:NAD(P)-dependent oxidoreductase [Gulosibacter faecalis]|uniref:NAD(P)-dependent oxidoreductase n=1 Tax=Gulosibacter faecalis TaxID=272240 RepID=A0ABW5UXJ1_9MICO|nr:NAD(P)-dependent oxidoreductase [Gulosibacter faecalis]
MTSATTSTQTVGFVGIGTMGEPMSSNIAKAGFDLRLYDVDNERAQALATRLGATPLGSAEDLAACDVIVLMLPTSQIVRSLLVTGDGDDARIALPLRPGTVVVDMSSSNPNDTVETGRILAQSDVHLVDAPVSGARERAISGTLSIMLGGDYEAAVQRAIPVIESMSERIYRTGKLGTGHAMKALNNFVAAAAYTAASEALISGERFGLDRRTMVDIFNTSTGQSFVTLNVLGPHIVDEQFASGFSLPLMTKDVKIAEDLQASVSHAAPVCSAVVAALDGALTELGNVDHTEAYKFWNLQ